GKRNKVNFLNIVLKFIVFVLFFILKKTLKIKYKIIENIKTKKKNIRINIKRLTKNSSIY
ncbi:hypothetical protein EP236_10015, partial [Campylobacter coli]|nr:hypothetical protein [Campylobacter coli]EAL8834241.1 hypothetical protein [Campylobacter coli]